MRNPQLLEDILWLSEDNGLPYSKGTQQPLSSFHNDVKLMTPRPEFSQADAFGVLVQGLLRAPPPAYQQLLPAGQPPSYQALPPVGQNPAYIAQSGFGSGHGNVPSGVGQITGGTDRRSTPFGQQRAGSAETRDSPVGLGGGHPGLSDTVRVKREPDMVSLWHGQAHLTLGHIQFRGRDSGRTRWRDACSRD